MGDEITKLALRTINIINIDTINIIFKATEVLVFLGVSQVTPIPSNVHRAQRSGQPALEHTSAILSQGQTSRNCFSAITSLSKALLISV